MEKNSGALLRFLSSIVVAGAVMVSVGTYCVWAQKPCGVGKDSARCRSADDTAAPVVLRADPSFEIGETLADALMHNCSFVSGVVVGSSASEKEPAMTRVRFQTGDWLLDDIAGGDGEREFVLDRTDTVARYVSNTDLAAGHRLMVGECFNWSDIRFVIGQEKYFASVRSTIDFHETNDLLENFDRVLAPLKGQKDNVFAGYVTECALRMWTVGRASEKVKVFGSLLADPSFPDEGLPRIGFGMLMLLYRYDRGLSQNDRDEMLHKLVDLTSEPDPDRATVAILVLARLSSDERLQLERYLDRSSSRTMMRSIRARDLQDESVAVLERRLQKIN